MSFLPYAVAAWLFLIGLYGIVSSRNLIRTILSLTVVQSATYVLLIAVGYRNGGQAPIVADIPAVAKTVDPVRTILIAFGVATAVWGAAMCLAQRHIKRLLAFSTISRVGVLLCGVGLLSARGLAGVAVYVVGHGLTKAALFMLTGVLLHRFGTVDEFELHGKGRVLPGVGVLFAAGGLLLAGIPLCTTFFGKSLLDAAALDAHLRWLPTLLVISSAVTGGAVLRVAGRVFLGWGPTEGAAHALQGPAREEPDEESAARDRTPPLMVAVPAVLLTAAIFVGLVPGAVPGIETAAAHFTDHSAYADWVLGPGVRFPAVTTSHIVGFDYWYGGLAAAGAIVVAALGLFGAPLGARLPRWIETPASDGMLALRNLHSGHIGDYIAWWTTGAAILGGLSLLLLT